MERVEIGRRAPLFGVALAGGLGAWLGVEGGVAPWVWGLIGVIGGLPGWWGGTWSRTVGVWLMGLGAFGLYATARMEAVPKTDVRHVLGEQSLGGWMRFRVEEEARERMTRSGEERVEFAADLIEWQEQEGRWHRLTGRVMVRVAGGGVFRVGEIWEGPCFLSRPGEASNPGQFDYRRWLEVRGIRYILSLDEGQAVRVQEAPRWGWRAWAGDFRRHMMRTVALGMGDWEKGDEVSALMAGMLFGFRDGISEPLTHAFRVTGTMHLFAVSGQNVAMVLVVLLLVLQVAGVVRWRWGWVWLPVVLIFCLSTGMEASAFRAFLMVTLVAAGWAFYRPVGLFNLLGAAALGMMVWDPRVVADVGFQLSFLVVLGIGVLARPLQEWMKPWGEADPWIPDRLVPWWRRGLEHGWHGVAALMAVSVAAWLGSFPLTWWYFHLVSPVALVANVVIVPLASAVLVLSVFSVTMGVLWEGLAVGANWCCYGILRLVMVVVTFLAEVPGGHFYVPAWGSGPEKGAVRMTILHFGQASPAVVEQEGSAWLVDPGPETGWDVVVDRFRAWRGINRWEGLVLTHGGVRRLGAAVDILQSMPVGWWAETGYRSRSPAQHRWLDAMEQSEKGKQFWRSGDRLRCGSGVEAEVLYPESFNERERLEDRGLVVRWWLNGQAILWAGDISREVEEELIRGGKDVQARVLVQGEHPLQPGPGAEWLEAVRPEMVVRPGRGYHPDRGLSPEFWETVERLGVRVLRMDETGAVILDCHPGELRVRPFRGR